jgi:signal transduction histidine kinase
MILLGIPFNIVFGLALWREVTVLHRYPMTAMVNHVVGSVLTFGLAWLLLWLRHERAAMAYVIVASSILVYVQIWTFENSTIFVYIGMTLVLPAIILPSRTLMIVLGGLCLGLAVLVQFNPVLQRNVADWVSAMFTTVAITSALMAMGHSIRRVFDDFATTVVAREEEAVTRARIEEHSKSLEVHHHRLLAAQHDLRAPCNTLLRTVQMIQAEAFDPGMFRGLLPQMEILATRLRTRMDALFDEAKAPRLGSQHNLPRIDLIAVVAEHLPELRRLATLTASVSDPDREPPMVELVVRGKICSIHAHEDELQRILENLTLNSVNAGAGRIHVVLQPNGTTVEVIVEDNGKGFAEAMLEKPFRSMYSQHRGGTGLGLVGVKANVEAFHGSLTLENWKEGARVRVCFPCAV